jgi:hypothetical protein
MILQILKFDVYYSDTLNRKLQTICVEFVQWLPQILGLKPDRINWAKIPSAYFNTLLVRGLTTDAHFMSRRNHTTLM